MTTVDLSKWVTSAGIELTPWQEQALANLPVGSFGLSGLRDPQPPDPGPGLTLTLDQGVYELTGAATFRHWQSESRRPDVSPHTRRMVRRGQAVVGRIIGSDRVIVLCSDLAEPYHRRERRLSRMHSLYRARHR